MEQAEDRGTIRGLKVVLIFPIIFICVAFLLNLLYSLPIKDTFLWYVGVFILFYIPGSLILRCLGSNKDEYFVTLFHSIALGTALMPLLYITFRRISRPELLYPFVIIIILLWVILTLRDFKKERINVYSSYPDIQAVLLLISIVFLLLHFSHFTDVIFLESGFKIRNHPLTENIFYLGIINMLKNVFPPLYPYASGTIDFAYYHLNMYLEIEMFNRLFSIDTIKLTFFYFPLLYFCLVTFVPYLFICNYFKSRILGIIAGILMFGSDLSFIPGLLDIMPHGYPWTGFFIPNIWAMFTLNGNLPALFVMFLCILYLQKYCIEGNLLYLLLFALLAFSAFEFKSTMGPHIMGAAFLTGAVAMVFVKDRKKGMLLCTVSVLATLAMIMDTILFRRGIGDYIFKIDFLNFFYSSLRKLGLSDMPWGIILVFLPVYILITLGTRVLVFYFLKKFLRVNNIDFGVVFLTIFIILGILIAEIFFLGDPTMTYNNFIWFYVQSLIGAWFLLSLFLARLRQYRKKFYVFLVIIILFSIPSTMQFLTIRFSPNYYTVDSNALEVVKYLESTQQGSVILHPPNFDGPSLASNLAGRPSVLSFLQSYVVQLIGQKEADNRLKDVKEFFNPMSEISRSSILEKYKVNYIYAPLSYAAIFYREPILLQVLKNRKYVVYRVESNSTLQNIKNKN